MDKDDVDMPPKRGCLVMKSDVLPLQKKKKNEGDVGRTSAVSEAWSSGFEGLNVGAIGLIPGFTFKFVKV